MTNPGQQQDNTNLNEINTNNNNNSGSEGDISSSSSVDQVTKRVQSMKKYKVRRRKQCHSRRDFLRGKVIFKVTMKHKQQQQTIQHKIQCTLVQDNMNNTNVQ